MSTSNLLSRAKTPLKVLLLLGLTALASIPSAWAQPSGNPPERIAYQGFLTDNTGTPLATNGTKNFNLALKLYDASSGGNTLWAEAQTATVDRGNVSLMLGEGTVFNSYPHSLLAAFATNSTASDRYLEVIIRGIGANASDVTMSPRLRLVTTPYAFVSTYANNLANANGSNLLVSGTSTLTANASTTINGSLTTTGNGIFNSYVGIGQSSPGFPLNFANSLGDKISLYYNSGNHFGLGLQNNLLQIHTDVSAADVAFGYGSSSSFTETMRIKGSGAVGIGTSTPTAALQVAGNIQSRLNSTTDGYVGLSPGSGGYLGYLYWMTAAGVRKGFMGWDPGSIQLNLENGANFYISNGSVGIGTATPVATLDVYGDVNSSGNATHAGCQIGYGIDHGLYYNNGNGNIALRGGNTYFQSAGGANTWMYINSQGKVGIGTAAPVVQLDVRNVTARSQTDFKNGGTDSGDYANKDQSQKDGTPSSGFNVSIRSEGYVEMLGAVYYSDLRIKKIVDRLDSTAALNNINRLQVTDYKMIDQLTLGTGLKTGLIAQEVESVMPEAVSKHKNFIPSVYGYASHLVAAATDNTIQVTLPKEHGFQVGDTVRLFDDLGVKELKVLAVTSPSQFVVGLTNQTAKLFVYGKQVDDFRTVDYDRIFTTGIGAIQELSKRSDAQGVELAAKSAEIKALKAQVARLAELERKSVKLEQMESDMAALKKIVARLAEQRGRPKSTQASLIINEN